MIQYAQPHAFSIARRIQLPAAFPPPCPKQIPQDPFWVPWALPGFPFGYPLAPPWALFGGLGHLRVSPWTPFGTRTKKEMKSDMEDPRSGVQVGTQNRHFSEKAVPNTKKMAPREGLEKGSSLEGVKTLKVMTLTALWAVFLKARGSQKKAQIE